MKKTIVLAGVVALSLGCWLTNSPGNAQTKPSSATASPFKGGLIVVGTKGAEGGLSVILEKATLYEVSKRQFLVGTAADVGGPDDWMNGQRVWVPFDEVVIMTEFPSLDDYKKTVIAETDQGAKESRD
jgi:hypothetical protein